MKNDIDEVLDDVKSDSISSETEGLPESPNSANIRVYINGFQTQFTCRDKLMKNVVDKIEWLLEMAKEKNWKNVWDTQVPTQAVSSPSSPITVASTQDLGVCPKCGAVNKLSSKGKPYCSAVCWKK